MNTAVIFNIQRFSIHDGPGIRTTVFFKGCPLRCSWCANPESQRPEPQPLYMSRKCVGCMTCINVCPEKALRLEDGHVIRDTLLCKECLACAVQCPVEAMTVQGKVRSVEELLKETLRDKDFYDSSGGGVTLSGGEPLLQHRFVTEFLRELRRAGIHSAMETSGYQKTDIFTEVLRELDFLYIDCKHPDSEKHRKWTGQPNELVWANIRRAVEMKIPMEVRIPVIPGFNDSADTALAFAEKLTAAGVRSVQLLPFHQMGKAKWDGMFLPYALEKKKALHKEDLEEFAGILEKEGLSVLTGSAAGL